MELRDNDIRWQSQSNDSSEMHEAENARKGCQTVDSVH